MCVHVLLCIFLCAWMCTGTFAIAVMEGTDGRGKWTPVPEEYCGAEDQSAAYVPPWAPVTHYSTWSLSSTSPSWTSPPRHLSPRTDNPPLLPPPSQHCVLASPAPPPCHPHPETKKTGPTVTWTLRVAFWSHGKTEGIWRDDSKRRWRPSIFKTRVSRRWSYDLFMTASAQFSLDNFVLHYLWNRFQASQKRGETGILKKLTQSRTNQFSFSLITSYCTFNYIISIKEFGLNNCYHFAFTFMAPSSNARNSKQMMPYSITYYQDTTSTVLQTNNMFVSCVVSAHEVLFWLVDCDTLTSALWRLLKMLVTRLD